MLRGYQYAISPCSGRIAAFIPVAPDYAREALERHGALKGSLAGAASRGALSSVSSRRFRSRPLINRRHPDLCVHGYPTSHPVRHLLLLRAFSGRRGERDRATRPATTSRRSRHREQGSTPPVPSSATSTRRSRFEPRRRPDGRKIVIKTDLFVANVDTVGGVLTQLALNAHRDTHDESKPYVLLQQNADRTFIAQSGLLGEGMPNHRTVWQALARSARTRAGDGHARTQVASARRRAATKVVQNADVPSRQLRDRRRVPDHRTPARRRLRRSHTSS